MKRYFVHRYMQIFAKFAIDAETQQDAITLSDDAADNIERFINRDFVSEDEEQTVKSGTLIRIQDAEQVEEFLVDEAGDDFHDNSRNYDVEGRPQFSAEATIPRILREHRILASNPSGITDKQRERLLSSISSVLRAIA